MEDKMLHLLLAADTSTFDVQTETVEVSRLSKAFGEPFLMKMRGLTYTEVDEIRSQEGDFKTNCIVKATLEPNFENRDFVLHFGVTTPAEAVAKVFPPGEIENLFSVISDLSGYKAEAVVEIEKK